MPNDPQQWDAHRVRELETVQSRVVRLQDGQVKLTQIKGRSDVLMVSLAGKAGHLHKETIAELVEVLQQFADTGKLGSAPDPKELQKPTWYERLLND